MPVPDDEAMGTVTPMQPYRTARDARDRYHSGFHPSLRWIAGDGYTVAHARNRQTAECGAPGPLFLAPPGVPLCRVCFPRDGDKTAFPTDPT